MQTSWFVGDDLDYFVEVFLDRFVPFNFRDSIRGEFDHLKHGSMSVAEYEVLFYALSKYSISNIATKSEKIQKFVKRLDVS